MTKKLNLQFGVIFMLSTLWTAVDGYASTYYLWDDWGGTWADADKTSQIDEDDKMCWAAAASNILEWTGWGNVVGDTDQIFEYFQDKWSNAGGLSYYGWQWWFTGDNYHQGDTGWAQETENGGGFWSSEYDFDNFIAFTSNDEYAMNWAAFFLENGYGTVLSLTNDITDAKHAITLWGYGVDDSNIWIEITDSDDGFYGLSQYSISQTSDRWELQYYNNEDGWYISSVQGLAASPAPEPSNFFLFGLALITGAGFLRRAEQVT